MIRMALAVAAVSLAASFAVSGVSAQSDPIAARKAIMKGNGAQTALGAKMVRGEEPFDLAKAKKIFQTYQDAAEKMPALYPDSAKTGGETTAAPKIWEDTAGFRAAFAKFDADAKAAEAAVKDLDSFKASFGAVSRNCGGCHELYRVKRS